MALLAFQNHKWRASSVSAHPTLTTSLVSYWELEETSGTRVDSHGSNDLTDINTVTSGTGKIGNAASYASANNETLEISHASQTGLGVTGDFSVNVWYNPTTNPGTVDMATKWGGSQSSYLCSISANGTAMRLLTTTSGSFEAGNNRAQTLGTGLSTGTWYMLTWVFDVSAGSCAVYKNGSLEGTITGYSTSLFAGTAAFRLGSNANNSEYVNGLQDEAGFWSRTLTAQEITDLYNAGAGLPY